MVGKVTFLYRNPFTLKPPFEVNQVDGKLTVDKDYLVSVLKNGSIDDYQVFSFEDGILAICDSLGSVVTIYYSSGLIDAYNLLLAFSRKEAIGNTTGYAVREFYRIDPQEDEYGVSIIFDEHKVTLQSYLNTATFDQLQFLKGLLSFSDEISKYYQDIYPEFLNSMINKKMKGLRLSLLEKFDLSDYEA